VKGAIAVAMGVLVRKDECVSLGFDVRMCADENEMTLQTIGVRWKTKRRADVLENKDEYGCKITVIGKAAAKVRPVTEN
jgi:hypothetical protein